MSKPVLLIGIFLLGISCMNTKSTVEQESDWINIPLKYATGFKLAKAQDHYRVEITTPYKGAESGLTYYLFPKESPESYPAKENRFPIPVSKIVCTSTTHIPLLDYLDETEALTGFPTLDYISSGAMRKRINSGKVTELGIDEALNVEKLIELKPDVVMGYSLTGDLGQFKLIQDTGIPVILNAEYLEQHPLGRAEWIKLAGVLFGKLDMADSVFNEIEKNYLLTQALIKDIKEKPTVMSGVVYGDSWYLPGGQNYASTLLSNAGYSYFWQSDTTSAFLPLSFEKVFEQAQQAEYWIGVASFRSLEEIARADQRYTYFEAYKTAQVYSYNKRIGEKGGSEFLELGYIRPDLILKDLVKISHPELLPEHELFFHFKLP